MSLRVMKTPKHNTHCTAPEYVTSVDSPSVLPPTLLQNLTPVVYRLPLYHFVTADLPSSTKSPELDDIRATAALQADSQSTGQDFSRRSGVGTQIMGRYLAYLIAVGFLPQPPPQKKERDDEGEPGRVELKAFVFGEGQKETLGKVGGRGGMI